MNIRSQQFPTVHNPKLQQLSDQLTELVVQKQCAIPPLIILCYGEAYKLGTAVPAMSTHKRSPIQPPDEGKIPTEQLKSVVEGVHLLPDDQGWVVRKSGKERIKTHFQKQEEAQNFAEDLSQKEKVQLFIHTETIQSKFKIENFLEIK